MNDFLDSNLLRCFLAVLDHRKLTVAADHLCLTQPALSKSLKRLEDELGVALFERTPGGMVPTTYGLALGRRAHMINLESKSARAELRVLREGGFGSISIGIGPLWSAHALPEAIARLVQKHSKVRVKVVSGVLSTLLPQLLKGELDVVCAALDFPDHSELVKKPLLSSSHEVVAHASHPLAGQDKVELQDLLEHSFLAITDDYAGLERMERHFALQGLPAPQVAVEASSVEMLFSLLATGAFVSSMSSQLMARGERLGLKRLAVDGSFWRFEGGLVHRRASPAATLIGMLESALREVLAELPA